MGKDLRIGLPGRSGPVRVIVCDVRGRTYLAGVVRFVNGEAAIRLNEAADAGGLLLVRVEGKGIGSTPAVVRMDVCR